jgi:aspartate 1-decarboxylase
LDGEALLKPYALCGAEEEKIIIINGLSRDTVIGDFVIISLTI